MGNNQSEGYNFKISSEQYQKPLKFHYDFDGGIHISPNQLIFRKFDHGRTIVISDRPLINNEIVCLKVIMFHKGTFKFGVTTANPENNTSLEFEKVVLDSQKEIFLSMLPKKCLQKDNLLFFQYTSNNEIMFGWSKKGKIKEKMTLLTGLPNSPLWAVFDIFGKNVAFRLENELIPILASLPSQMLTDKEISFNSTENIIEETLNKNYGIRKTLSCEELNQYDDSKNNQTQIDKKALPEDKYSKFFKLPISSLEQFSLPGHSGSHSPTHQYLPSSSNVPKTNIQPEFKFHSKTGKNVMLVSNGYTAIRKGNSNTYVFTPKPIMPDETVTITINTIDKMQKKGLSFGMTVCNPDNLNELPDDGDELLDREEYWIYVRDVVRSPLEEEEIKFSLSRRGRVSLSRNKMKNEQNEIEEKTLVHVDLSVSMWMFFELSGCVFQVSFGGVSKRQALKRESNTKNYKVTIPNTPSALPISSSIDFTEQHNMSEDSRRKSTSNLRPSLPPRPAIPPRPSFVYQPKPTSPKNNVIASDIPVSLVDPLIPLPPSSSINPTLPEENSRFFENSFTEEPKIIKTQPEPPTTIPHQSSPFGHDSHNKTTPPSISTTNENINSSSFPNKTLSSLKPQEIEDLINQIDGLKKDSRNLTNDEDLTNANTPECSICLDLQPDCVLYTCGHMCLCYDCAHGLVKSPNPFCPICRKEIKDIVKIYRS